MTLSTKKGSISGLSAGILTIVENEKNISKFRYAVDRIEDLELVKILMSRIKKRPILLEDILEQFNADPSLININKDIDYYEGFEKSKKEDIDFLNSKK